MVRRSAMGASFFAAALILLLGSVPIAQAADPPVSDGLQLWLSADSGVTSDVNGVSLWADLSGNGLNVTQTDNARKPELIPSAFANGLPAIRFTAGATNPADDRLDGAASTPVISGTSARSVFIVTKENIATTANVSIMTLNTTTGGGDGTVYRMTPEMGVRVYGSTEYLNHPIDQEYRIIAYQNPVSPNTNNTTALLDGIQIKPSAYTADQAINTGTGGFRIGDSEGAGASSLTGDVAEVLVYNRKLTAAETNAVGSYLETKYGLKTSYVPVANQNNKVKVWLLGGQSNMRGHGNPAEVTDPTYQTPQGDVMHYHWQHNDADDDYGWEQLTWGGGRTQTTQEGGFGPELSFGRAIADAYPDERIALIKNSPGGTNLHTQWDPIGGSVYAGFIATAHDALAALTAQGLDFEIAGMLWMQGESDTGNAANAAAYEDNLNDLIAAVRAEFDTPEMPFIMGLTYGNGAYTDTVRAGQLAVAAADMDVLVVNIDDRELVTYDTIHMNTASQLIFGQRLAEAYQTIPEPATLTVLLVAGIPLVLRRKRK